MRFGTDAIVAATLLAAVQTTASVIPRGESTDACGQIYNLFNKAGNSSKAQPRPQDQRNNANN